MPAAVAVPLIAAAISTGGAVAAAKMGNKSTSTSTPTLDPKYGGLQDMILASLQSRLASPTPMAGYQAQGIQGINHTFDLLKQSQENNLTARGLAGSPIAAQVDATRDTARGGGIAAFTNSLPLLQRDMQTQDLGLAGSIMGQGRGLSTTASTAGSGTAAGLSSLGPMLAYLYASGAFGQKTGGSAAGGYQPGQGMPLWAGGAY